MKAKIKQYKLTIFFLITTIVFAFSQIKLSNALLTDVQKLLQTNDLEEYIKAYKILTTLQNQNYFPAQKQENILELRQQLTEKINSLTVLLERNNKQILAQFDDLANSALEYALEKERKRLNNPKITVKTAEELDMSGFGLVKIPEQLSEAVNLKRIDLQGNPFLDTNQALRILGKLPKLKRKNILFGRIKQRQLTESDYSAKKYEILNSLKNTTYQIRDKQLKMLALAALNAIDTGQYSAVFNYYDVAYSLYPQHFQSVYKMDSLFFQYLILTTKEIQDKFDVLRNLQLETQKAIFNKALILSGYNFRIDSLTQDSLFLLIDSLTFEGLQLTWLPWDYLEKCRNLEFLNLVDNNFKNIDSIVGKLRDFENLRDLWITLDSNITCISTQNRHLITGIKLRKATDNQIPDEILMQKQLKYLNLSDLNLNKLTPDIKRLGNLMYLYLDDNNLTSLPKVITDLSKLQVLSVKRNQLRLLPENFGKLHNLTTLVLSNNKIEKLPGSFVKLKSLRYLYLDRNNIEKLPDNFGKLTNLTELKLNGNFLTDLPKSLFNLKSLRSLNLDFNNISQIPDDIIKLQNLEYLSLNGNGLTEVSKNISRLKNLNHLEIKVNPTLDLNVFFTYFSNTSKDVVISAENLKTVSPEELIIVTGKLDTLPNSLQNITNLKKVILRNSDLKVVKTTFTNQQKKLEVIDLRDNDNLDLSSAFNALKDYTVRPIAVTYSDTSKYVDSTYLNLIIPFTMFLPNSLVEVKNLEVIDLERDLIKISYLGKNASINLIEKVLKYKEKALIYSVSDIETRLIELIFNLKPLLKLPDSLNKLTNLKVLDLENNRVIELPKSISNLKNLEILNLNNNETKEFDFYNLVNLKYLNLQYCRFSEIPNSIGRLRRLRKLVISNIHKRHFYNNRIVDLPEEIGYLINLDTLEIRNTNISELPASFANLINLKSLDLSDNELKNIDPITKLKRLRYLDLSHNKLATLPTEIGNLQNLEVLNLCCNNFVNLSLPNLPNLQSLEISWNKNLTDIQLSKLPNLQSLKISYNDNLSSLILPQLPNLQSMIFEMNKNLNALPLNIATFPKLAYINLSGTSLDKDKFTEFLRTCTKPVKLKEYECCVNVSNDDPRYLLIVVDRIEEEWFELPNVSEY